MNSGRKLESGKKWIPKNIYYLYLFIFISLQANLGSHSFLLACKYKYKYKEYYLRGIVGLIQIQINIISLISPTISWIIDYHPSTVSLLIII
jgi:hypothetical protein